MKVKVVCYAVKDIFGKMKVKAVGFYAELQTLKVTLSVLSATRTASQAKSTSTTTSEKSWGVFLELKDYPWNPPKNILGLSDNVLWRRSYINLHKQKHQLHSIALMHIAHCFFYIAPTCCQAFCITKVHVISKNAGKVSHFVLIKSFSSFIQQNHLHTAVFHATPIGATWYLLKSLLTKVIH